MVPQTIISKLYAQDTHSQQSKLSVLLFVEAIELHCLWVRIAACLHFFFVGQIVPNSLLRRDLLEIRQFHIVAAYQLRKSDLLSDFLPGLL